MFLRKPFSFVLLILTFFLTFLFYRCSQPSDDVIATDTFSEIFTYLIVIEKMPMSDDSRAHLMQTVLYHYDVTAKQFIYTKQFYKDDAAFWIKVYRSAQKKMESLPDNPNAFFERFHPKPTDEYGGKDSLTLSNN